MALERLEGDTDEELGKAVHEARKSFKRLRTTVRLARDELGDDVYRHENATFRDAGRRLAGARDSQVLLETLPALSERNPDEVPPARFAGFRRMLAGDERTVAELAGLIERRRDELRREALGVGGRLYGKKPRKLARPVEQASTSS